MNVYVQYNPVMRAQQFVVIPSPKNQPEKGQNRPKASTVVL